jgi:solute carrier family 50 protein (sugar transporter)
VDEADKEEAVDNSFMVPEHVVTIAELGELAVELKTYEVHPVESPPTEAVAKQEDDEPAAEELLESRCHV